MAEFANYLPSCGRKFTAALEGLGYGAGSDRGPKGARDVIKPMAWMFAGAVLATAGAAHAQDAVAANPQGADLPWFQRFTASSGLTESLGQADAAAAVTPSVNLSQRWGVTIDMAQPDRVERGVQGLRQDLRQDQAAVGAYYQFTPRLRVGGQLSIGRDDAQTPVEPRRDEKDAGVRIESAFRF